MNHAAVPVYTIGIDARFLRPGMTGIGTYTRELLRHLALIDRHNQYVVFITEQGVSEWNLDQENFRTVVVSAPHYTLAEQTNFLKVLNKERLDLVHFLNFNHPILYTRPFVTTLHDLTLMLYPQGKGQKSLLHRAAFRLTIERALRSAKKIIAISEHTAKDAEKYLRVSHAKMEVVYDGGPKPAEHPFGSKAMVQDFLGMRDPYFLFVSEWRPHKGVLTLIEAFGKFKAKTGLPHKLILSGKQKKLEDVVKDALASSPVTSEILTPGFVPDELLPSLYHHSTATLVPSEYEGFGLPPLEAFSNGAPVIVANNSSLPEVVGQAGLYFPTRDADALAACMEEIVSNQELRSSLVEKGYAQLKKFPWERTAQQTLAVYMSVLEKKR